MLVSNKQSQTHLLTRPVFKLAALALGATLALSACGGHEEEVKAVDKVDEAAELARENAPEPEPLSEEDMAAPTNEEAETDTADETDMTEESDTTEEDAAEGTDEADSDAATSDAPLSASAGKELYESKCQQCHGTGLLESPKFGDAEAWAPRIAQGKEVLYKHSAEGYNQMPAQATGDVTEEQVHAAVDYMVEQAS